MRLVFGKRGANPPLPRNCKRREYGHAKFAATGFRHPGKAVQIRRRVSQETGQTTAGLSNRPRWEGRRE